MANAKVTITGTPPNQEVSFEIPQGPRGLQGIQGPQGIQGIQGIQGATGVLARWAANTPFTAGTVILTPDNYIGVARTTHTSGATYNATNWRELSSKGVRALTPLTANTSAATTTRALMTTGSFTFEANRWYNIEWYAGVFSATASTLVSTSLVTAAAGDSATAITNLTEISNWTIATTAANQIVRIAMTRKISYATATTLQVKGILTGAGVSSYIVASTTNPAQLSITDLGPVN